MTEVRVLSLFDGISCGRVALERAGIKVSQYVAFEIDKYAISVSKCNYPDIEHRGSVVGADFSEFKGFDLVIGGFPCTDLSTAKNNRKGLKGNYSSLFWELVRAIKEVKPKYFLVENNYGMPEEDYITISQTLGVIPILINSALVSAQQRRRYFWTNINLVKYGLFDELACAIPQPKDKGLVVKDILEKGERQPLSKVYANRFVSYTPTHTYGIIVMGSTITGGQKSIVYSVEGKMGALTATDNKQPKQIIIDNFLSRLTPIEYERLQTLPDDYTAKGIDAKGVEVVISNSQRYKQLGNGWTVDIIAHIFKYANQ